MQDVYRTVDDDEYNEIVRKRQLDDFVDDDGLFVFFIIFELIFLLFITDVCNLGNLDIGLNNTV